MRIKTFAAIVVLTTVALLAAARPAGLRAEEPGVTFFGWSDQHIQGDGDAKHVLPAIDAMNSLPGTKYPEAIGGTVASPAMVLGCGDMTDHPTPAARDTYNELITHRLKFPAYDVLGNHDEGGDQPTEIMKDWFRTRYGALTYTFDRGGVHFIILYSHFDESLKNPAQAVTREALDDLRKELAKVAKGSPVVVAMHLCSDAITNRDELIDALGDSNVLLVLTGHYHKSKASIHRGINFVQFPSPAGNLVRVPPARPGIGAPEIMVLRITSDRLLAIPYDYKTKTWITKPGKMLDAAIRGPRTDPPRSEALPTDSQRPKASRTGKDAVSEFRGLPDNRIAVRTSLGLRSAEAVDETHVEIVLGMSVTPACGRAVSYRILSFQDDGYAYEKFVMPLAASARTELEIEGPAGCPFPRFQRTVVRLELPRPLKEGVEYFVVAQGSGQEMVTGGHTAQPLVFRKGSRIERDDHAVDLAVLGLRQIEPVGPGIIRLEFGPAFSAEAAHRVENYRVRIAGAAARVVRFGRITKVDAYLPTGWPFVAIPVHEIFLELDRPLKDGDTVDVEVDRSVTTAARTGSLRFESCGTVSNSLKVNQVGYLTDSPVKIAYLGRWMGSFPEKTSAAEGRAAPSASRTYWDDLLASQREKDGPKVAEPSGKQPSASALAFSNPPEFQVCREADAAVAFRGMAKFVHRAGDTSEGVYKVDHSGENVYVLDFTAMKTPGRYFISVPGVGRSLPFSIGDDVYKTAFEVQSYGVFAQRCGIALGPPQSEWRRIACHRKGLVLTSQNRNEQHDIHVDLARKVVRRPTGGQADPALERVTKDAWLVAYYPLDGDFRDASGHGRDLTPVSPAARFSPSKEILPTSSRVLGPTQAGDANGATARGIVPDDTAGYTICGWFKKDENNDFHGVVFGLGTEGWDKPHATVTAGWGVLSFSVGKGSRSTQYVRLNDNAWHHLALVAAPASEKPRRASLYVDGRLACSGDAAASLGEAFSLGTIAGSGAGNAWFADFRLYARTLEAEELLTLATPRPAVAPVVLAAYGGHHDAGDYNPRSHLDVAQTLMDAYEMAPRKFFDSQLNIPERGNGVPDILDEAYWALRLWLDLQDEDGGVYDGTEGAGDPNFIQTVELDPCGDYAYAKDATGSYWFAGAMAQASRLWRAIGKPQDADALLARARRAYRWADEHPPQVKSAQQYAIQYLGPKAYAAAQLLHTTGEAPFNKDFLDVCVWSRKPDAEIEVYGQYDQSLAAWAYVNCPAAATDPKIRQAARKAILQRADVEIRYSQMMAYGFIRNPWAPINWGTGAYENYLPPVMWAYKLTGDEKYRYWIVRTCDNTLGANPLGRSYVVGLGTRTVRAPLHNSRYCHLGEVVPGQQVEGPVQKGEGYRVAETAYPPIQTDFASLQTFVDCHFAIGMDEGMVSNQAKTMAAFGLLLGDPKK